MEHSYGGDLLNVDDPTKVVSLKGILDAQWGAQVAERHASLATDYDPLKGQPFRHSPLGIASGNSA